MYWKGLTTRGALGGMAGLVSSVGLVVLSPTVWVKIFGYKTAIFPYDHPAIVSMTVAFFVTWLLSVTDKSERAARKAETYEEQFIRCPDRPRGGGRDGALSRTTQTDDPRSKCPGWRPSRSSSHLSENVDVTWRGPVRGDPTGGRRRLLRGDQFDVGGDRADGLVESRHRARTPLAARRPMRVMVSARTMPEAFLSMRLWPCRPWLRPWSSREIHEFAAGNCKEWRES